MLQQFLKNILKYQKLLKCASIFFFKSRKSGTNTFKWTTSESQQHATFFFLSYLKPTHVMPFKNMLSFSVHNYAGIMKKSAASKIIIISSLIL